MISSFSSRLSFALANNKNDCLREIEATEEKRSFFSFTQASSTTTCRIRAKSVVFQEREKDSKNHNTLQREDTEKSMQKHAKAVF